MGRSRRKCDGRFLTNSDAPPSEKKLFKISYGNANPSPLHKVIVINMYLVKILLHLTGWGSGYLLPIHWGNLQILRRHILSLTNPTLLGMSWH